MKQLFYFILFVFILFGYWACRKNTNILVNTIANISEFSGTPIDKWIYDSLTVPYNLQVKYRFDGNDNGGNNVGVTLVPPIEENIIPLLRAIKRVWIDVYEELGGRDFIRTYIPKQIVLVGSNRYNSNGTVTKGVAEGGKRILLFDVNSFDLIRNFGSFKEIIHTIEHEFGHILHQTVLYPEAFRTISLPADYTAQWFNVDAPENYIKGFVTPYAMFNTDEDFVETLSNILYLGDSIVRTKFNRYSTTNNGMLQEGYALFKQKAGMVRVYLRDIWNINFKQLENSTLTAMQYVQTHASSFQSNNLSTTVSN